MDPKPADSLTPHSRDDHLLDRQWRGYDPRAAAPLIALATLISAVLLAGRWFLDDYAGAIVPYLIVLAVWPGLLGLAIYRAITYTYRINGQALFIDRGSRNPPELPIWLRDIRSVNHGASWFARQCSIGWVHVVTDDGREVLLTALRHPELFAKCLTEQSKEVKSFHRE